MIHTVSDVPDAMSSQNHRGEADIEREFTSPTNERFVVHASLGFEAGGEGHIKIERPTEYVILEFVQKTKPAV